MFKMSYLCRFNQKYLYKYLFWRKKRKSAPSLIKIKKLALTDMSAFFKERKKNIYLKTITSQEVEIIESLIMLTAREDPIIIIITIILIIISDIKGGNSSHIGL